MSTATKTERIPATVHDEGNGLPDVGHYVAGNDGEVYTVAALGGQIFTGGAGAGQYRHAILTLADWSDVSDDDAPVCSARPEVD